MKNVQGNWGAVFASRMKELGITTYALRKATGIAKNTLYRTVKGERDGKITHSEFELICKHLNLKT